jgi:type IV pilus assembly protein PilO
MALSDTIKGWPWYGQAIFFVVIASALFYFGHWQLIAPKKVKIGQLNRERDSLIAEINKGETLKARSIEFEAELKRLENQLDSLKKILPETEEVADLYSRIQQEGTELGLAILMFRPGAHAPREYYEEWPINISLNGTYHTLAKFFERLGKLYRIINVNNVAVRSFARAGSSATVSVNCIATTFIYREQTKSAKPVKRGGRP